MKAIYKTFEARNASGDPISLTDDTVTRDWIRASVDFVNYRMEGWDRCRQLVFELDYVWRTKQFTEYAKGHPDADFHECTSTIPYCRFRLVRNGNCSIANYDAAVALFLESVHLPAGVRLVPAEDSGDL